MLILSRKQGEAILVDGGIRIVVLATDNGSVRLGIEAPSEVGIVREEIVHRIADENRRAGATAADKDFLAKIGKARDGETRSQDGAREPEGPAPEDGEKER
jgi:carbon storage regulator